MKFISKLEIGQSVAVEEAEGLLEVLLVTASPLLRKAAA